MVKERLKNDSMNMNPDIGPCFFKIIYDGVTTEHLRIPPKFVKYISEEVSDRAILKGPSGSHWQVEVSKNKRGIYLKGGWQCFLSDHSLGDNEFLIFRYDGNTRFNVQIFEKNGLERIESVFSNGERKQGKSRENPVGSLHTLQMNPHQNGPDTRARFVRSQSPTEEEREKVFETTKSFTSKFPYFESCLKQSSVQGGFVQPIPVSFGRTNLPKSRTKINLWNPKGRAWEVICVYNGKRYAFSGGWGAFVRGNKLKVGDICLFELVDKDNMQVHTF